MGNPGTHEVDCQKKWIKWIYKMVDNGFWDRKASILIALDIPRMTKFRARDIIYYLVNISNFMHAEKEEEIFLSLLTGRGIKEEESTDGFLIWYSNKYVESWAT